MTLLRAEHLVKHFPARGGTIRAVDGVSFELARGETLGVVGESGCGKSTLARLLMHLEKPTAGRVYVEGREIFGLSRPDLRRLRRDVQMVMQDPYTSLNPRMTVGDIVGEPFEIHPSVAPRRDRRRLVAELLERVGLRPDHAKRYPHQFSGGMRQRVSIAMALALNPAVLIADEPTTALDVTVQAQILDLLAELRRERNMALLLITHDLGVVAEVADRIAVMYAGRIVEQADVRSLFRAPAHPYTRALLASAPIVGVPPNLADLPAGCAFQPRCGYARDLCRASAPSTVDIGGGRASACHFAREVLVDAPTR
ncbi:MAG: peptide ABC transporter ATP-binding protein [Actinobacteria bacterium 13_1_20CM_3_71_11]|nr:MAG: peptide ABC transporter ATP-binding protein [Actinobacteria bacterium 13_1_20CM_3_71_11]